jgi:Tfp pilus assembly protein FimT
MRTSCTAFSLVELLVVITIIVVLLALLTPALDQAIYQAELARCSSQQHGIAYGAVTYAFDFRRNFPHRPAIQGDPNNAWADGKPSQITDAWHGGEAAGKDDRPVFRDYIALKFLSEPAADELDFDPQRTDDDAYTYSGMSLFFGFWYKNNEGMTRLGNRLVWTGQTMLDTATRTQSFDFLAGDSDMISILNGSTHGSHPDRDEVRNLTTLENDYAQAGTIGFGLDQGFKYYFSRYDGPIGVHRRGPVDLNFAHSDGAVTRVTGAAWDDEERVTTIPEFADANPDNAGKAFWLVVEK